MNPLPQSRSLDEVCPMCGTRIGVALLRCTTCGEFLFETGASPVTDDDYLVIRARSSARITGFFIALVGTILAFFGAGGLWSELSATDPADLPLVAGLLMTGLCWLIGGVMIFRCRSIGYWFVQPINLALSIAQLVRLDKFNMFLFALIVVFALLCERTRRLLRDAGTVKSSSGA